MFPAPSFILILFCTNSQDNFLTIHTPSLPQSSCPFFSYAFPVGQLTDSLAWTLLWNASQVRSLRKLLTCNLCGSSLPQPCFLHVPNIRDLPSARPHAHLRSLQYAHSLCVCTIFATLPTLYISPGKPHRSVWGKGHPFLANLCVWGCGSVGPPHTWLPSRCSGLQSWVHTLSTRLGHTFLCTSVSQTWKWPYYSQPDVCARVELTTAAMFG